MKKTFIGFFLVVLLGFNLLSAPTAISAVQLYFPLNNNDSKNYMGSILGSTYYATYNYSQVIYNGRTCYVEVDSLDGSMTYYGYSASELQMFGASAGGYSFTFDTPLTILNDSILNNGGSLQSSTTLTVEGTPVNASVTVTSSLTGSVNIPLGRIDNCRTISMTVSYSIPGESETLDVKEVWTLAPNIGKLRIAVMDESLIQRGWLDLTSGTVGGNGVIDIIKPIIADFEADFLEGFSPLTVQFTDLSSGLVNSWYWDFGDGADSSSQNPQHVFSSPGRYTVTLTVTGLNGSDAESKVNYINVKKIRAMPWMPLLLLDD